MSKQDTPAAPVWEQVFGFPFEEIFGFSAEEVGERGVEQPEEDDTLQ